MQAKRNQIIVCNIQSIPTPKKDGQPFEYDFAEQFFYNVPKSNEKEGLWEFDGLPHRYISIQHLTKVPELGQLTRERSFGNYHYGLFDKFPEGAVFVMTVVIQSQEIVKNHLERIEEGARKSNSTAAAITFEDCQIAKAAIEKGNFLFPTHMGIYFRGNDQDDLADKETELEALLINNGFQVLKGDHELLPIHSYLNNLPFCYNYQFDKKICIEVVMCLASNLLKILTTKTIIVIYYCLALLDQENLQRVPIF